MESGLHMNGSACREGAAVRGRTVTHFVTQNHAKMRISDLRASANH